MTAKECIKYGNFKESYENWKKSNARWKNHWFETCVSIFSNSAKWAKEFTIDLITKTITRISEIIKKTSKKEELIIWNCENRKFKSGSELFYLIKGVDENNNILFSKIGTTTRTISQRMNEHLKYYRDLGIKKIIVDRVYDCGKIPAECYESWFRAKYILKYPNTFKKNDRFFGVTFDLNEADKIFAEVRG